MVNEMVGMHGKVRRVEDAMPCILWNDCEKCFFRIMQYICVRVSVLLLLLFWFYLVFE